MENKSEGNESKIILYLGTLIVLWIKSTGIVKKLKAFINVAPLIPCQNWPWIMVLKIYGRERTKVPLSSPTTIDPLKQDPGYTGSILIWDLLAISRLIIYWYPLLIIVMFAISLDRLPSKTKTRKD